MLIFSVDYIVFIIVIVFLHVSNFYTLRSNFFTVFQVHVPFFSNICRVNNFYPSYFSSDVEKMHKEEIKTENDDLKHHIRCYDSSGYTTRTKRRLFWIQALSATSAISTNEKNDWKSNWKKRVITTWLKKQFEYDDISSIHVFRSTTFFN